MSHYQLKTTLKDQLQRIKESDEARSLMSEVALARLTVQRAVHLYEVALTDEELDAKTENTARAILAESVTLVERLLSSQAKLEALISPFDAETFLKRVEQVLNRRLKAEPELFDQVMEDLRSLDLSKKGAAQIQVVID